VHHTVQPVDSLVFLALFPLAGLAGGYTRYVLGGADPEGSALFAEANRMLSALYRITRTMPGGLEISAVARAAANELAESLGAQAGAILVEEGGALTPAAAFGIDAIESLAVHPREGTLGVAAERSTVTVLDVRDMEPAHRAILEPHARWFVAPVRRGGAVLGLLVAAEPQEAEGAARAHLQRIAAESAVAIENARLFQRVRGLTIDAERRRVARDIHDGVAQALTHIRFELDHLRRHVVQDEEAAAELDRLGRIVARAGEDVRATIVGLRSGIAIGRRLTPALESYLSDLRGLGGPEIEFHSAADPLLSEEVAAEAFRIGQEAVSNALRHSDCRKITVTVGADADGVVLQVEDDGKGINGDGESAGVGLRGMKERAAEIGATLEVAPRPGGGALVRLLVPREVGA
jgi:signal transduction histidine kinase